MFKKSMFFSMMMLVFCFFSCSKTNDDDNGGNANLKVTTYTPADISGTSASCGGDVIVNSGDAASQLGVCWSTAKNPTVSDSKLSTEVCDKPFVCTVSGLNPGTTYHVRAFAKQGTSYYYGNDKSFTTLESGGNNLENQIKGKWERHWDENGHTWNEYLLIDFDDSTPNLIRYMHGPNEYGITANGKYEFSGDKIIATYDNVTVFADEQYNYGTLHGFTHGQPKTVTYTVQSCTANELVLKESIYNQVVTLTRY